VAPNEINPLWSFGFMVLNFEFVRFFKETITTATPHRHGFWSGIAASLSSGIQRTTNYDVRGREWGKSIHSWDTRKVGDGGTCHFRRTAHRKMKWFYTA
jgi:hypothetical protein